MLSQQKYNNEVSFNVLMYSRVTAGHPRQPTKPLLRLRVEFSDETDMFNVVRFGHR